MKKQVLLISWVVSIMCVKAQQDPRFSLFNYNYAIVNPATVGSKEKLSALFLHRQQWVGYGQGRPYTSTFSIDAPIFKLRSAIGLNAIVDNHGIVQNTFVGVN